MTAQISDGVIYQGDEYALAADNGSGLFEPSQVGLHMEAWMSACWHGFYCIYSVINGGFYLTKAHLGLDPADVVAMERGERPNPFGQLPHKYIIEGEAFSFQTGESRPCREESSEYVVEDIHMPIPYTGGILIGRDYVPEFEDDLVAPQQFKIVHELVFEAGRLIEAYDRSEQIAQLRVLIATKPKSISWTNFYDEIRKFYKHHFRLSYS